MHNHSHTANFRILALNACLSAGISSRFNCCSAGNPRTVTPLQNAHYSVTVLDAQVRPAIKRYHVEVVSIQAELAVELAPGDFCGNGPITLRVEGALPHTIPEKIQQRHENKTNPGPFAPRSGICCRLFSGRKSYSGEPDEAVLRVQTQRMDAFQWKGPCDPSDLVHFRNRIGPDGFEKILKYTAQMHGDVGKEELYRQG